MDFQKQYFKTDKPGIFALVSLSYDRGADYCGGAERGYYAHFYAVEIDYNVSCVEKFGPLVICAPSDGFGVYLFPVERKSKKAEARAAEWLRENLAAGIAKLENKNGFKVPELIPAEL